MRFVQGGACSARMALFGHPRYAIFVFKKAFAHKWFLAESDSQKIQLKWGTPDNIAETMSGSHEWCLPMIARYPYPTGVVLLLQGEAPSLHWRCDCQGEYARGRPKIKSFDLI